MGGASREGGKIKPLKQTKKVKVEDDEDTVAYKARMRDEAAERKKAAAEVAGGKKLGGGLKKSGKK